MNVKSRGFTLIELFVTVAIALILGSVALIGYHSAQKKLALDRSAFKLAQDIRRAQEMAMAQEPYEGDIPEGGYGVFLLPQASSYIFFRDLSQGNSAGPNHIWTPGDTEELIEEIPLESGVEIENLSADCVNIVFAPPFPYIYFKDIYESDLGDEISVTLSLESDPSVTKTIKINKAGLIYVAN